MAMKNDLRFDPRHTRALFATLIPEPEQHRNIAEIFGSLIETAHGANPAGWQMTIEVKLRALKLSVAGIWILSWSPQWVQLALPDSTVEAVSLPSVPGREQEDKPSRAVRGVSWVSTEPAAVLKEWPSLRPALGAAILEASKKGRARQYRAHSAGAVRCLEQFVGRELPDPAYCEGSHDKILQLMRLRYENFGDFDHAIFLAEERDYKLEASRFAREVLAEPVLRQLIASGDHQEIDERLRKVAQKTNLLWMSSALQGDLAPLNAAEGERRSSLIEELVELLYGEGSTTERLERWVDRIDEMGLPNKWTFPTYFLFMVAPAREIFVKPQVTQDFSRALGFDYSFRGRPDPWLYDWFQRVAMQLREGFSDRGARDMIDVQTMVYVVGREAQAEARDGGARSEENGKEKMTDGIQSDHPLPKVAEETGLAEELLDRWLRALERKKQAILYGPPGTGKTFLAEHLARHLIGGTHGFRALVQFHPSYAYEDFIQGIRPRAREDGELTYEVVPGIFLEICQRARELPDHDPCVLIIDEINRANLSRVFGELMYLLEYRDRAVPMAGGGELRVPKNLRILDTMNTADRSIALVDHALRRRFAFLPLRPDFEALRQFHRRHETDFPVERLIEVLAKVNATISDRHYEVGISYFLRSDLEDHLEDVWQMEIEPFLEEYFFDRPETAEALGWRRIGQEILG